MNSHQRWTFYDDVIDYQDFIEQEYFAGIPLADTLTHIQQVYLSDCRPWVIGYSGGKDSSAVMVLVYFALLALAPPKRHKPVFVVSSDTLVETPVVMKHIQQSIQAIAQGAKRDKLPIHCHLVTPKMSETFWTNLLGKGYPAPTHSFRWCTERLKINPVSDFIRHKISEFDEVIVVLGSRVEESTSRAQIIAKHKIDHSHFAHHTTLANAFIYTPIAQWKLDDVWKILRLCQLETHQHLLGSKKIWRNRYDLEWENPWGGNNRSLWTLYQESSNDSECPMVIDESTPSCGNSRFGCWTCTVVNKDRAMESLINHGEVWMEPLLAFRNMLSQTTKIEQKRQFRNFKRRNGKVSFQKQSQANAPVSVPGPYWMKYRQQWLEMLLRLQKSVHESGHDFVLIQPEELHRIRQHWLTDPNEPDWQDRLPHIYHAVYGHHLDWSQSDDWLFQASDSQLIADICQAQGLPKELMQKLIELAISMQGLSRRSGINQKIATILNKDWGTIDEINANYQQLPDHASYEHYQEQIRAYHQQMSQIESIIDQEF